LTTRRKGHDFERPQSGYQLTVYGNAEPAGSKRAFYRPKLGVRVVDDNKKAKPWKDLISQKAGQIACGQLQGPLLLEVDFYRTRPKGHYGTGKNACTVKASAPAYPDTKPDTTKLLRGVEDALTGIFYRDDAQICRQMVSKRWGDPARVVIRVSPLTPGAGKGSW
jgi:Holliday junction resolvase RusA-like endonuclease